MKYAYIAGTSAFIIPSRVVSYRHDKASGEFLRINSIYHDLPASAEKTFLDVDINIKDTDGKPVVVTSNNPVTGAPYTVVKNRDSIQVLRIDGSLIIEIHQLAAEAAMGLEHNITSELEINAPVVVIRITGEFLIDSIHVRAENENLFLNNNGYATSAMVGHNQLVFTPDGIEI